MTFLYSAIFLSRRLTDSIQFSDTEACNVSAQHQHTLTSSTPSVCQWSTSDSAKQTFGVNCLPYCACAINPVRDVRVRQQRAPQNSIVSAPHYSVSRSRCCCSDEAEPTFDRYHAQSHSQQVNKVCQNADLVLFSGYQMYHTQ